jgi:uncharacterized protein (TIGR00730 family)
MSREVRDTEERLRRILESPSNLRADRDLDFLARDELRAIRLQLEFLKPELLLEDAGVHATIVVFGGTRIPEQDAARRKLEHLRAEFERHPDDADLERRLAIAERILAKSHYYEVAREFGRIVGRAGRGPADSRLVVVTGGGPGLMEAANRGSHEVGADSAGLNIALPREQAPNPYIAPHLSFQFRYFALRKMHLMLRAKALVAFPGGYGTLDELFEMLCLLQTGKREPLPVVLVGEAYWRGVFDPEFLVTEGTIDSGDLGLFWYAETAEEIWQGIRDWYVRAGRSLTE